MTKHKILWIGDSPNYDSKMGNLIKECGTLICENFELLVFGINNHISCYIKYPYNILDTIDDTGIYGYNKLRTIGISWFPDIVVICGSALTITNYILNVFGQINCGQMTMIACLEIKGQNLLTGQVKYINTYFSNVFVLTSFGQKQCIKKGITSQIHITPCGFNKSLYLPMEKKLARERIKEVDKAFEFNSSDFIIYSGNPNIMECRMDILVHSYVYFLKKHWKSGMRQPILILEFSVGDSGWLIQDLFLDFCNQYELELDASQFIKIIYPLIGLDYKNLMYNSVDIGITTAMSGEWNRTVFNHGGIGKPQIMTTFGDLASILDKGVYKVPAIDVHVNPKDMEHYKIVDYQGVSHAINYYYNLNEIELEEEGKQLQETISKYKWFDTVQYVVEKLNLIHLNHKLLLVKN